MTTQPSTAYVKGSVKYAFRKITGRLAPHLPHQNKWENKDGGGIYCHECERRILEATDFIRLGVHRMRPDQKERLRDGIARWIRANSPDSARIIVPMSPRR